MCSGRRRRSEPGRRWICCAGRRTILFEERPMHFVTMLAMAIGMAAAAPAQPPAGEAARSHEARKGDFTALMLLTTDEAQFLEAWAGPTPPHLVTSDRVRRGEIISAM